MTLRSDLPDASAPTTTLAAERDRLAQIVDEILDIEGMDSEHAAKLIMAARQHWFA